ncbi:MAG: putative amidohydrolase YtcJ [Porticoccaceae bacterium]|jgi:predicted amidohydrolase YtcJ
MKNTLIPRQLRTAVLYYTIAMFTIACSDEITQISEPIADAPVASPISSVQDNSTTVYHNAKVYTVDVNDSWAEAVAVENGKITAVGSNADVLATAGENANKVDLQGRMVMPGIHDTHMHPSDAGISKTLECSFRSNDLEKALITLKACIDNAKPGEWVRGGQWNEGYFVNNPKAPKQILDEIAPNNPVFLMDWSVHHAWVNSAALEKFGINKDSQNAEGGSIQRDATTGEATGLLYDNEAYNKRRFLPAYSVSQETEALAWSINEVISYGITTIKDAIVTDSNMAAYQELFKNDRLPLRVKTNLSWKSAWATSHDAEKQLIKDHKNYQQSMIDTGFVKIMLDGVPMTYTSVLLKPYEANEVVGADHTSELMIPLDELKRDVIDLDKQGLSIKIHATGDGSARAALDAFEAARKANPDSNILHEVSHAEMIHADDVARFKELNVVAEMCPTIWYPLPGLNWETWFGKDRLPIWQVKTLYDSGAIVSYGSDWPVVPTANPWPGIEAMVTRSDPLVEEINPEFVEEAVDLKTALRIFTHNSAIANLVGDSSGSLEVGKDADFIVLDQAIFDVPITRVSDTNIILSVIAGNHVVDKLQ